MKITAYKTPLVKVGDSLREILEASLPPLEERDIVVISLKIVSLCEKQIVDKSISKEELIKKDADAYFETPHPETGMYITLKEGILLPTAGIDESNCGEGYLLYPKDPFKSAESIYLFLKEKYSVSDLGVVLCDSRSTPLRRGSSGVAVAWYGVEPTYSYIGSRDLYGRKIESSVQNIIDGVASMGVLAMGEGDECTPVSVLKGLKNINFYKSKPNKRDFLLEIKEDVFSSIFIPNGWKKGD